MLGRVYPQIISRHEAKLYTDATEQDMFVFRLSFHPHFSSHLFCGRLEAMAHPRCVGWGEIGLDYHYDNSPRDIQRSIFIRQLRNAVKLRKPITIHTREAEEDTERILKEEVPKDHRVSSDDLVGLF
jgi:TatD DNase family protein